jgi:hypothetical protein
VNGEISYTRRVLYAYAAAAVVVAVVVGFGGLLAMFQSISLKIPLNLAGKLFDMMLHEIELVAF